MAHVMTTILGRGRADQDGYRTADYRFESGAVRRTPYFGLALLEELAQAGSPADRVVVLGTGGSIWGALLGGQMGDDALWVELSEAAERHGVTQPLLDRVRQDVVGRFRDADLARDVDLRIIPAGRDEAEQVAILRILDGAVAPGDEITMDLSHGYRHLPMIGLVSALLLGSLKDVRVRGLYYGALEMTEEDGTTPVVQLDGLLRVAQWRGAVEAFRHSGDYGVFGPLLAAEGLPSDVSQCLSQGSFYERILRVDQARGALRKVRAAVQQEPERSAVLDLFAGELLDRTAWVAREPHFERQMAVARTCLAYGDYIRAAALALESLITAGMPHGKDPLNHKHREPVRQGLNEACKKLTDDDRNTPAGVFFQLNTLRNSLAHGTRPKGNRFDLHRVLDGEDALAKRLSQLLDAIDGQRNG